MMVVTGASCCKLLKLYGHVPPRCLSSSKYVSKELCGSKGWGIDTITLESRRQGYLVGRRVGHKHISKLSGLSFLPCIKSNLKIVSTADLCLSLDGVNNVRGKSGRSGQSRRDRCRLRCYGMRVPGEMQPSREGQTVEPFDQLHGQRQVIGKGGNVSRISGCGKQAEPSEASVPLKDVVALEEQEQDEQGHKRLFEKLPGEVVVDEIPISELLKIQELKFSGDMWEGDSGPQVLDLQRALYWFGYLPNRTGLTGFYGPETKRALQHFQSAHGVLSTGVWGSSSRQALWKHLSGESSQTIEGGSIVNSSGQLFPTFAGGFPFQSVGGAEVGFRVSELLKMMGSQSQDFIATVTSAPQWRHLPMKLPRNAGMVVVLFGMALALFGVGYSVVGMFNGQPGQPVRRRVMRAHWRDDMAAGPPRSTKKHLQKFPGLDLPLVEDDDFMYPNYRLRTKSKPSSSLDGTGRTERLIMHEGQVIVGDSNSSHMYPFKNDSTGVRGRSSSQVPSKAVGASLRTLASSDQSANKSASNGSISGPRDDMFSGGQVSMKRTSNVRVNGYRGEEQMNMKTRSNGAANSSQKTMKSRVGHPGSSEQAQELQPNFVRNLLSALFTPRGLGQPVTFGKFVQKRTTSGSPMMDTRSFDKDSLSDGRSEPKMSMTERSTKRDGTDWQDKDEDIMRDRVEELRKAVEATEQNRRAAMRALAEERQRSLELQVKISRQKEAAVALEEEVRVLKESHDALLASLRKKYSSSVAARAAAALLYQNWDTNREEGSAQTVTF